MGGLGVGGCWICVFRWEIGRGGGRGERCWKRGRGGLMIDDDVISINYRYGFSIGGGTLFLDCSFLLSFIEAN